jgi:hypothetical protein
MKAHELLNSKDKWTQGSYSRDSEGFYCPINSPKAVKFCAAGAIYKCYGIGGFNTMIDQLTISLFGGRFNGNVSQWNDENDFQTVHSKLRELDI